MINDTEQIMNNQDNEYNENDGHNNSNIVGEKFSLEEMSYYFNILNIFQSYYKNLYSKFDDSNMFENINFEDETSTNRSMELFYEYMHEYRTNKQKNDNLIKLYDETNLKTEQFDDIYCLLIDNKINKFSPSFFPLLMYIEEMDWQNLDWKVTKLKGEL